MQADLLNWTGYVYGGLAHSAHIQYDEERERRGEASVRRGLARLGQTDAWVRGKRVLDVGTGLYGLGFARLGAVVEHRDISSRTVAAINNYARERSYANLSSHATDLVNDELPAEHFDVIYLSGVYQHLGDPARALRNLARALKPGGYLYLDIYRSGRWRWFVVDVLRKIVQRTDLEPIVQRFAETCTLGATRAFHLRQLELLVDDLFVENLHLFTPADVLVDATALGLQAVSPATSMNLVESERATDHSMFFAHVFNTLALHKVGSLATPDTWQTSTGRCQVTALEELTDSYRDVMTATAELVLAHQAGTFSAAQRAWHAVCLFRMAHPCMVGDPYFVPGQREASGSTGVASPHTDTLGQRHDAWLAFLANVLGRPARVRAPVAQSLGYELVRFLPESK